MAHLPSPLVYTGNIQGVPQFAVGSSASVAGVSVFPAFNSTVVLDSTLVGGLTTLTITAANWVNPNVHTTSIVQAALWGGGGTGGAGSTDSPAGDLIGGSGGSGECVVVGFVLSQAATGGQAQFGFSRLAATASIQFTVGQTFAAVNFIDANPAFPAPKIKSIVAIAGASGTAATYSVNSHFPGTGGAGGGTQPNLQQLSIAVGDTAAVARFLSIGPDGSTGAANWAFAQMVNGQGTPRGINTMTVVNVSGPSGATGNLGGLLPTNAVVFDPLTYNPGNFALISTTGLSGFVGGAGSAGCGSSRYVSPASGGSGKILATINVLP